MPARPTDGVRTVADTARFAEDAGFDGIALAELSHDPMIAAATAAMVTERIDLMPAVLIAFARSPMTVAMSAADVHDVSQGRFVLGLGSQVKAHIEHRFGMPWSKPAARMRDFVLAVRAIWHSFDTGERLTHNGEFYRHTLLTPMFNPGPSEFGRPPIWIAGVNRMMTEVAGEVGDGFIAHSFTTRQYFERVTAPALHAGAVRAGREPRDVGILGAPMVAMGADSAELDVARQAVRQQLAFYGSTPAYRPVLDMHGWGDVAEALSAGARRGEWVEMADLVSEEMLTEFAAVGTPDEVAAWLREHWGDLASGLCPSIPYKVRPELLTELAAAVRAGG